MSILHYIGGPLVGALIGYCTNYIAVKMLFRPRKEIKIAGIRLPFTPGIIPKRKGELARAVGRAVGDTLVTEEALGNMLMSQNVEKSVVDLCVNQLTKYGQSETQVQEVLQNFMSEQSYEHGRNVLSDTLKNKIMDSIIEMKPGDIIAREGKNAVVEKLQGTMFAMFLSESLLDTLAGEIGSHAEKYILECAPSLIQEQVEKEIENVENMKLCELGNHVSVDKEHLERKVSEIYRQCISRFSSSIVKEFHIAEIVEEKISAMDVKDLEDLVMSVMKHELGMIVNLGALIGLLLGILNLFF